MLEHAPENPRAEVSNFEVFEFPGFQRRDGFQVSRFRSEGFSKAKGFQVSRFSSFRVGGSPPAKAFPFEIQFLPQPPRYIVSVAPPGCKVDRSPSELSVNVLDSTPEPHFRGLFVTPISNRLSKTHLFRGFQPSSLRFAELTRNSSERNQRSFGFFDAATGVRSSATPTRQLARKIVFGRFGRKRRKTRVSTPPFG